MSESTNKITPLGVFDDQGHAIHTDDYDEKPPMGINPDSSINSLGSLLVARSERLERAIRLMSDSKGFESCDIGDMADVVWPMAQELKAIAAAFVERSLGQLKLSAATKETATATQ
jgi:hypothetical protein